MADRQVPSIGRVVHYVGVPGGGHRPAMVLFAETPGDPDSQLGLYVFDLAGLYPTVHVKHDPTGETPGTWHWPEYVPAVKA